MPTNVTAQSEAFKDAIQKTVTFKHPDTIINEGQAAPFNGVLVSEPVYRKYQTSMDASALLQRKLDELSNIREIPREDDTMKSVLYFLAGAAAGGLTAALMLR